MVPHVKSSADHPHLFSLCHDGKFCIAPMYQTRGGGVINSQLTRCSIARGSSARFSWFSPTKIEARNSYLFTEVPLY